MASVQSHYRVNAAWRNLPHPTSQHLAAKISVSKILPIDKFFETDILNPSN
jgi:hypothetical protein